MANYVILFQFTQKGAEAVKAGPSRVEALKTQFREMGAELKDFYMLLGHYDTVIIAEAPDDETIARVALSLASKGNVRSETHRAFTLEQFRDLVTGLP